MDVSFTGIKNVGTLNFPLNVSDDPLVRRFVFQLNDRGKKDFDFFEKKYSDLLLKDDKKSFIFDMCEDLDGSKYYVLNGQKLEVSLKNMPVFNKIDELLTRVFKSKKPISLQKSYLNDLKTQQKLVSGLADDAPYDDFLFMFDGFNVKNIHNPLLVKNNVGIMKKKLHLQTKSFCN